MAELISEARLRPMQTADLELVLQWRNAPEVSRYMYNQDAIGFEEHCSWFARKSSAPGNHLLILENGGVPQGFARFEETADRVFDWGFYKAPGSAPGTGHLLGYLALSHAFDALASEMVCGHVLARNHRSIRLHERFGFIRDHDVSAQRIAEGRFEDVLHFRLLAKDWRSKKGNSGGR